MQALKALVIFMAVVIVVGLTVIAVTIYNRLNRPAGEARAPAASTAAMPSEAAAQAGFGEAQVTVPAGCRVVEMVPAGDRLLLRLGSQPRCNRILVVDLATGRELGGIELVPQP